MLSKTVGSYNIIEKIAFGGMGVVYKGIHTRLEQFVAIKVLSPQFASNQNMKSKFLSEAKIQAQLSHPNVVNIMNFIEEEDETYLIMEYIDGETLEELLQRKNKISFEEAINISRGILSALRYMHSKGLAHRDIKPSNIMFNKDGIVKVTDFGITKIIGDDKNTKSGLVGSYTYMSPEHILGEDAGIESDIYSFGVTLYRMVTGQVPFKGDTEYAIMKGHLENPRVPPWIINPQVPRKLGKVILKAISRKPKDRYRDTDELLNDLEKSLEPGLFFDTNEIIGYKNLLNYFKINTSYVLNTRNLKTATPVLLAFSIILITFGFSFSKNYEITTPANITDFFSGVDFNTVNNKNNVRDVSWEYIVSKLANNNVLIKNSTKNLFVNTKKKNPTKIVKNEKPYYKGIYTYTNFDEEFEEKSLKSTLKRTKILPIP
jgi:serine/threonine protein kinase